MVDYNTVSAVSRLDGAIVGLNASCAFPAGTLSRPQGFSCVLCVLPSAVSGAPMGCTPLLIADRLLD